MIHQVFTIYDSKAGMYFRPFCAQAIGQAIRMFDDSANDPEHQFCVHAEDFSLFHLGSFDDADATVDFFQIPKVLVKAHELRRDVGQALETDPYVADVISAANAAGGRNAR